MGLTKISSEGIKPGEVKSTNIADDAVTQGAIDDNNIINAHLQDDVVGIAELSATGTASSSTFLRGDNSWVTPTDTNTQRAFANDANNRVVTGDGSGGLNGEANLTYDGTHLTVGTSTSNASDALTVYDPGNAFMSIRSDAAADNQNQVFDFGVGTGDRGSSNLTGTVQAVIHSQSGGTLKSDLYFSTNGGNSISERFRIKDTGNVEIKDGDLVIKTAGHGIDFSINSHASGMTSELLHGYEEGTWTPDFFYHSSVTGVEGHYTKIGRMVYAYFCGTFYSNSGSQQYISNLPFTVANISGSAGGVARGYQNYDIQNGPIYWMEQNTTKMYFYKDNGVSFTGADGNGNNFRGMVVYTATS